MTAAGNSIVSQQQERAGLTRQSDAFDYDALASAVRRQVVEETAEIRRILEKTAENIVQIGLRLNFVHNRIGRNHFQPWLAAEFQWDQSTASNYMRAAAVFCEVKCLNRFQPGALYELVRKRVPEGARAEAIDRAQNGELITKAEAETIVRKHSASPPSKVGTVASQICRSLMRMKNKLDALNAAEADDIHPHVLELLSGLQRLRSLNPGSVAKNHTAVVVQERSHKSNSTLAAIKRNVLNNSRKRRKRRRGA